MDYIMETVGLRKAYKDNIVVPPMTSDFITALPQPFPLRTS